MLSKARQFLGQVITSWFPHISLFGENLFLRIYKKYGSRLPSAVFLRFRFLNDLRRFERSVWLEANGIYRPDSNTSRDPENLAAVITMEYHRIEKGLALPNRRVGAGQDVVVRLIPAIREQLNAQGTTTEGAISLRTLDIYLEETPREALNPETVKLLPALEDIKKLYHAAGVLTVCGGYREETAAEIQRQAGDAQVAFLRGRHSIRDYRQDSVDESLIREITEISLSTPSVCNRQAWKLYAVTGREMILKALSYQNGNRGFTERIPLLFVVATDLRRFVSVEERNQGWIDGGLFSMTLMLAIHAKGLGSCPLNWSASRENDEGLRQLLGIPDHETVVMMVAAGHLPDRFRVTASPRRAVSEVLSFIDS